MKILLLISSVTLLASCTSTRKSITKTEFKVDSTAILEKDDSIRMLKENNFHLQNEIHELEYQGIVFDNPCPPTAPPKPNDTLGYRQFDPGINHFFIKTDGSIEASGRIKSIFLNKEKIQNTSIDWKERYDSLSHSKEKRVDRYVVTRINTTKTVRRGWPWYIWFSVGALIMLTIIKRENIYSFIKKIRS